jgi:hypothetical protein
MEGVQLNALTVGADPRVCPPIRENTRIRPYIRKSILVG